MLGDTDRQRSADLPDMGEIKEGTFDLEPPAASMPGSVGNPLQGDDGGGGPPGLVVCPNLVADLDREMTRPDGSPTWLFRVAVASVLSNAFFEAAGKFWHAGMPDAYARSDPLLAVSSALFVVFMFAAYGLLSEFRRVARVDGPLAQLGVGTALISEADEKSIRFHYRLWHPRSRGGYHVLVLGPFCLMCVFVLATGFGAGRSDAYNRVSAVVEIGFFGVGFRWYLSYVISLRTATALASANVLRIAAALRAELATAGEDMSAEEWQRTVVQPCREVVPMLQMLSDEWGVGLRWFLFACACAVPASVSMFLSPANNAVIMACVGASAGVRVGAWAGIVSRTFWFLE